MKLGIHSQQVNTLVVEGPWRCAEAQSADLRTLVQEFVAAGQIEVTLDLSRVPSADSTAVGAIASCHITLQKQGGRLILLNPTPRVTRLLEVSRLVSVVEVRRIGCKPTEETPQTGQLVRKVDPSTYVPVWTVAG
tara:strand:- start:49 stop:453 length:405 start_codon:yes stop_codon:yes gene_type:complete